MRDVELPQLVLAAELGALPEDLLDHRVVLHVPVYPRLRHEHGDVPLERVVVLLQRGLDGVVVPGDARVLDRLGQLAQLLNVLLGEVVELAVRLLGARLHHNRGVEELVQVRREQLVVVCEVGVLCEHVCREIVVLVLALEQEQVAERLRREGRVRSYRPSGYSYREEMCHLSSLAESA